MLAQSITAPYPDPGDGIKGRPGNCRFRRKPATYSDLIAATLPI